MINMNIPLKNIFKIIPFTYLCLVKLSFIVLFVVGHGWTFANMDASHPWQVGFQDPATPIMEGIIFFNGFLMTFMILIACLVGWLLYKSLSLFDESVHTNPVGFSHSTLLEVVWTIIPAAILMIISIPSYNLLYAMDEVIDPSLTIKVVGHQWYWSYECSDFEVAPELINASAESLEDRYQKLRSLLAYSIAGKIEGEGFGCNVEPETRFGLLLSFVNYYEENIRSKELSEESSTKISKLISSLIASLAIHESKKDFYIPSRGGVSGDKEMMTLLSDTEDSLKETSLLPPQKELFINILKTFKIYARMDENIEPEVTGKEFVEDLVAKYNSLGDQGSNNIKSADYDDDDGSVVSDLVDFDESRPYWGWCELIAAEKEYNKDEGNLLRFGSEALTSDRICTNAALFPDQCDDETFLDLIEKMTQDKRKLKKAFGITEISQDKLMDTQLIDHQLRLTRSQRDFYSSKFAWDKAVLASKFAEFNFDNALAELNSAKDHSHWSKIDLAAANVNKLTADYFLADASVTIADPRLIRSIWINKNGYYSWTEFLRLASKNLFENERLKFIDAYEKLYGANSLLGKAQRELTLEERNRSNAIADNAKGQFIAMEKEGIPAVQEFLRGETIVAKAEAELKTFQDISDRSEVRLGKAQMVFDKAKSISDRAQAELNGAEKLFKSAQAKLKGVEFIDQVNEEGLNMAQQNFELLKKQFDEGVSKVYNAKLEVLAAQERLKVVNKNLKKIEGIFEDTGLLEKQYPIKGKPTLYYPNYLWEIHREDLAFVNAQVKTDTANLEFAINYFDSAKAQLGEISSQLIESELKAGKSLINVLHKLKDGGLLDSELSELSDKAEKHLLGLELRIAETIYDKALAHFKLDDSENSKLILARAIKGVSELKTKGNDYCNGYLDSVKLGKVSDKIAQDINSVKLFSDYAEKCLMETSAELSGAEADYSKSEMIFDEVKRIAKKIGDDLDKNVDHESSQVLKGLYKSLSDSLKDSIEEFNLIRLEASPLDIKMNPGLLQTKSSQQVLIAEEKLRHMKWLAARVAKTLDIPLMEEVKPFHTEFSHLKDYKSTTSSSSVADSSNGDYNPDDKGGKKIPKSKSIEELEDLLDKVKKREISYTRDGLKDEVLRTFFDLFNTLKKVENKDELNKLANLLTQAFNSIVVEETQLNQQLSRDIESIKEVAEESDKENQTINFDSYLIGEEDLVIPEAFGKAGKAGKVFRLLEVDNRLFVPTNTHIRVLITSADVLHSWAVPSLGVKVDSCPGRLNQVFLFVKREGVFYGQCSELCGVNHGFMPIVVQAVSPEEYVSWVGKRLCS